MTQRQSDAPAESEIRRLLDERGRAVAAKDVEAVAAQYAPDVVMYNLAPPLQRTGVDRRGIEAWFSGYRGPIGYEVRDLTIASGGDVAYCHYLYHITGTLTGGAEVDMWVRATLCFGRDERGWRITHEHDSDPFDMETFKAITDLKP